MRNFYGSKTMKSRLAETWEELDKELQRIENYLKEVGEQLKKEAK